MNHVGALLRIVGTGVCLFVVASIIVSALQLAEWWMSGTGVQLVVPTRTWWAVVAFWALAAIGALALGLALHAFGTRLSRRSRSHQNRGTPR